MPHFRIYLKVEILFKMTSRYRAKLSEGESALFILSELVQGDGAQSRLASALQLMWNQISDFIIGNAKADVDIDVYGSLRVTRYPP